MTREPDPMRLEVLTPTAQMVEVEAIKIVAEGPEGFFAILPRHIDCAVAMPPGLFSYVTAAGEELFLGIDEGLLVKCGHTVRLSVLAAFASDDLASLKSEVTQRYLSLDEQERASRSALARLEAGAIRRVLEIEL